MRFSKLYNITTKEAPKDASLPSHKFLIQAGFIDQIGSGLYNYLPLGKMVIDNIRNIVKDELDSANCNEVSLSFVTPADFWKNSGRYSKYGKELLRFKDRKDNEFVLAPTQEETIVELIKGKIKSYKQLPLNLYHFGLKFRDEARPRFGLLRAREFLMKDGYSFHSSFEDLDREFNLMHETYSKIFTKLGLDFRAVEADSGAIGGSGSKEFMILAQNGEDDIIICSNCDYAANIEAAIRTKKLRQNSPKLEFKKVLTQEIKTIDSVCKFLNISKDGLVKAVIKKAIYEDRDEIVVFFIRGDDELQEVKAINKTGALELVEAIQSDIDRVNLVAGYCGPINFPKDVKFFIDNELKDQENLVVGANEENFHFVGASLKDFDDELFCDLIEVKAGDCCAKCGSKLQVSKGIEVGHIFKLGTKYSLPLNATYLDNNGKTQPFVMGCYGIGISRLVAVMIEASFDEKGCIWPSSVTPFDIVILISSTKDEEQVKYADKLYEDLKASGRRVLLDDRDERFGVKINDFELMGFPKAIIIGKSLKDGFIEIVDRKTLAKEKVLVNDIFTYFK